MRETTVEEPPLGPAADGAVLLTTPSRRLSVRDFRLYERMVRRESGIHLTDAKRALVESRLSPRLRELRLGYRDYFSLVEADEQERVRMLDAITTNETRFFREPAQFAFLEQQIFTGWRARADAGLRSRLVRVWSAACSSGEEAYSVAMSFLTHFPPGSGWQLEILATDISTRMLARAEAALYPLERSVDIPTRYLHEFMLRGWGPSEGRMKAGPALRSVVRFLRVNLNGEPLRVRGPFDLILCRNVLIYFDADCKRRVLGRMLERLDPEGFLFLGHAEALAGFGARMRSVGPTIYVHDPSPEPRPAAPHVDTLGRWSLASGAGACAVG